MKRSFASWLCTFVFFVTSAVPFTDGQNAHGNTPSAATGSLRIEPVKELRKGVDLWPLIVKPANPAEQRVNESLTRLNTRMVQALHDCDVSYLQSLQQMGADAKSQNPVSEDWTRRVLVTMAGPRFLSLVATDEVFCGGAHPDSDQMAMVFDMITGKPVNWPMMLPKSAGAASYVDTVSDGSTMGALVLPALKKMLVAAAYADCKDAFQDSQSFLIWPDAKNETLVAQPFDLPHVVQACANEIDLTIEQARKLGFGESLLSAIKQAHSQIAITSKP